MKVSLRRGLEEILPNYGLVEFLPRRLIILYEALKALKWS